jgi:hypothetical protein
LFHAWIPYRISFFSHLPPYSHLLYLSSDLSQPHLPTHWKFCTKTYHSSCRRHHFFVTPPVPLPLFFLHHSHSQCLSIFNMLACLLNLCQGGWHQALKEVFVFGGNTLVCLMGHVNFVFSLFYLFFICCILHASVWAHGCCCPAQILLEKLSWAYV